MPALALAHRKMSDLSGAVAAVEGRGGQAEVLSLGILVKDPFAILQKGTGEPCGFGGWVLVSPPARGQTRPCQHTNLRIHHSNMLDAGLPLGSIGLFQGRSAAAVSVLARPPCDPNTAPQH